MPVVLMFEWDNAKDRERYRRYAEYTKTGGTAAKKYPNLWERLSTIEQRWWTDNTGHLIGWYEFENLEGLAGFWADEEWHKWWMELNPMVDNLSFRLLRPSVSIPEELT